MNSYESKQLLNPYGKTDTVLEMYLDSSNSYRLKDVVNEVDEYTFVIWYKADAQCNITFNVLGQIETVQATTQWKKYIKTIKYTGANNFIDITPTIKHKVWLYEGFIAKGNKDKSWVPAPEDVEEGIDINNELASNTLTIAEQTAERFSWIVKSGNNSTNFELTDRTATLVSNYINLKGLVTFQGLNSATQDKINAPNEIIQNWNSNGTPQITDNTTTINGGYIKTNTITLKQLVVEDIFQTGNAVMNIINAQEINANRITSGEINVNRLNIYGLRVVHKDTNKETLSIGNEGSITLRGSVESYNYNSGKTGWAISRDGDAEFNDVTVRGSLITNDGGIVSGGGSGRNLLKGSHGVEQVYDYPSSSYSDKSSWTTTIKLNSDKYTLSFWAKSTIDGDKLRVHFYNPSNIISLVGSQGQKSNANDGGCDFTLSTNLTQYWVTYTIPPNGNSTRSVIVPRLMAGAGKGRVSVKWEKLEEGDIVTPYSLAPEDKIRQVRFWAGASYAERDSAPFKVYNTGEIEARDGLFSGVFTGDIKIGNISIVDPNSSSGGDANLTIQNGQNGLKVVQLRDAGASEFAQQLNIVDNAYHSQISLKQDGTGVFNTSVSAGSNAKVILENGKVTIGAHVLDGYNSKQLIVNAPTLAIGSTASSSQLYVHGSGVIDNDLTIHQTLFFGGNVKMTQVTDGLDINIIK